MGKKLEEVEHGDYICVVLPQGGETAFRRIDDWWLRIGEEKIYSMSELELLAHDWTLLTKKERVSHPTAEEAGLKNKDGSVKTQCKQIFTEEEAAKYFPQGTRYAIGSQCLDLEGHSLYRNFVLHKYKLLPRSRDYMASLAEARANRVDTTPETE